MMLYCNFARAAPSGDRRWHKSTSLSQFEVSRVICAGLGEFRKRFGKYKHGSDKRYGKFNLMGRRYDVQLKRKNASDLR